MEQFQRAFTLLLQSLRARLVLVGGHRRASAKGGVPNNRASCQQTLNYGEPSENSTGDVSSTFTSGRRQETSAEST